MTIATYFFLGATASILYPIATTYANEFIVSHHRAAVTSLLAVMDATSMIWQVLYYANYPNMYPLHWVLLIIALAFTLSFGFFIPESPKYYYAKGRYDEAREVLKIIANFNGKDAK